MKLNLNLERSTVRYENAMIQDDVPLGQTGAGTSVMEIRGSDSLGSVGNIFLLPSHNI